MVKQITFFIIFSCMLMISQTQSFAYTVDETPTIEEAAESPFLPTLPLADLMTPVETLTAPTALEETVFPDHGEIILDQNQNSSSL